MQVPGLRIPRTRGCRPCGRPELDPAHTCTDRLGKPSPLVKPAQNPANSHRSFPLRPERRVGVPPASAGRLWPRLPRLAPHTFPSNASSRAWSRFHVFAVAASAISRIWSVTALPSVLCSPPGLDSRTHRQTSTRWGAPAHGNGNRPEWPLEVAGGRQVWFGVVLNCELSRDRQHRKLAG